MMLEWFIKPLQVDNRSSVHPASNFWLFHQYPYYSLDVSALDTMQCSVHEKIIQLAHYAPANNASWERCIRHDGNDVLLLLLLQVPPSPGTHRNPAAT